MEEILELFLLASEDRTGSSWVEDVKKYTSAQCKVTLTKNES